MRSKAYKSQNDGFLPRFGIRPSQRALQGMQIPKRFGTSPQALRQPHPAAPQWWGQPVAVTGMWPPGRCPSRTCATLGTIRGGTASAVGSSEARRFWRALPVCLPVCLSATTCRPLSARYYLQATICRPLSAGHWPKRKNKGENCFSVRNTG